MLKGYTQGDGGSDLQFSEITLAVVGEMVQREARTHVGRSQTGYYKSTGERMLQAWSRVMPERMDEHDETLVIFRK